MVILEGQMRPSYIRSVAYLRGQADALEIPVIDTSELTVAEVAARVRARALLLDPGCFLTRASS